MTGKTHIMGGIASTVAISHFYTYEPAMFIIAGAIGGIIPDICHGGSKIGRRIPLISRVVNTIFGHRTFTHSLLFLVLMYVVLSLFISNQSFITGLLVGMISHLVLDAATKNGIKLLYPVQITIRFPLTFKTGGQMETIILLALTLVTIYYGRLIVL
ncbi:metal-dependent hydrolase [Gracilibacillus kekensis]|uniref:Inner membrane protein n=1 Tax=Gracilibacillus kekensis TaxID=1027249 RepID=A0A1M7QGK4_9BACI|nr:metal-dependent hydrolase [Gracilibacillus kekensis]SHN30114.1 inner membrane protein [Gracilibacillus kekensis]